MRTDNFKHLHTYPDAEAGTLEEKVSLNVPDLDPILKLKKRWIQPLSTFELMEILSVTALVPLLRII